MKPPALAQALIAATATANDYDVVVGDLHEEYLRLSHSRGLAAANRWYWTQTLLSLVPLLSYSRSTASTRRRFGVALVALAVLAVMMVVAMGIDTVFGDAKLPAYAWVCMNYADALIFGSILTLLIRDGGVRVTFFASVFLVLCFVLPAVAGHTGSRAPLTSWIFLLGTIPAMCIGAGICQALRRTI